MKKLKYYIPIIFLSLLIFLNSSGCKEEPPIVPPPPPPVQKDSIVISIADVTHRSVSVSLQSAVVSPQSTTIKLFREFNSTTNLVAELPGVITDTTIIDDDNGAGLLLDETYSYYAVIIDSTGNVKDTSSTVTARTLAPTTHNYTWTEYTIGEWQSYLTDVWGTDENNVYAVGSLTINGENYSVLHNNGSEWTPVEDTVGGFSIFGFSANDIWVAGGGVYHYDGIKWRQVDAKGINGFSEILDTVLHENAPYTSLWGTSSSNLYLGNIYGKIIHWDGEKADVMNIQASVRITDIYGITENIIYATAGNTGVEWIGELYQLNGGSWELIKTGSNFPSGDQLRAPFNSVWTYDNTELYVVGDRVNRRINNNWEVENLYEYLEKIRGTKPNNLFICGHHKSIAHYNGIDWMMYELGEQTILQGLYITTNKAFVVGTDGSNAKILIGIKN